MKLTKTSDQHTQGSKNHSSTSAGGGQAMSRRGFLRNSGLMAGGAALATTLTPTMMKKAQASASAGFDYDCSGGDEPEFPDLVSCAGQGANCNGSGWVNVVPGCGESGSFAACQKKAGGCDEQAPKDKTQRCH